MAILGMLRTFVFSGFAQISRVMLNRVDTGIKNFYPTHMHTIFKRSWLIRPDTVRQLPHQLELRNHVIPHHSITTAM